MCPTECGVSECVSEAPIMRRRWPTRCCCAMAKKYLSWLCKSRLEATLYLVCRWLAFRIFLCLKWTRYMEKSTRIALGNPVYSILAYGPNSYHSSLLILTHPLGTAVTEWLRCCATNRKVVGSIPDGVIGIFLWRKILPIALWPWGRLSL